MDERQQATRQLAQAHAGSAHAASAGGPDVARRPPGRDPQGQLESKLRPEWPIVQKMTAEYAPRFEKYGIHLRPETVLGIAMQESGGSANPATAHSFDNGLGVMQITPYNGQLGGDVGGAIGWNNSASVSSNVASSNWRDPTANIKAGVLTLLGKVESLVSLLGGMWWSLSPVRKEKTMLFAYNAGEGTAANDVRQGKPLISYWYGGGTWHANDYVDSVEGHVAYVDQHDPYAGGANAGGGAPPAHKPQPKPSPGGGGKPKPEPDPAHQIAGAKRGETSGRVRKLQALLDHAGAHIPETGYFGPITTEALHAYQSVAKQPVSNVVSLVVAEELARGELHLGATKAAPPKTGDSAAVRELIGLQRGMHSPRVATLQALLDRAGAHLPTTGFYGPLTTGAMGEYEKAGHLGGEPTVVGEAAARHLVDGDVHIGGAGPAKAPASGGAGLPRGGQDLVGLRFGAHGAAVKKLQELLDEAGAALPTTGNFLSMTDHALREYQKAAGRPESGIVDAVSANDLVEGHVHLPAAPAARPSPNAPAGAGAKGENPWAEKAIAWQSSFWGSYQFSDYCLGFVNQAYNSHAGAHLTALYAGSAIGAWENVPGKYRHAWSSAAPRGAIVFWGVNKYNTPSGHVAIYLGDGTFSTSGWPGQPCTRMTIARLDLCEDGNAPIGWIQPGEGKY